MSFGPCNDCCTVGNCELPSFRTASFVCTGSKTQTVDVGDPASDLDVLRSPDWGEVRDDAWECGTSYTPHDNCDDAAQWTIGTVAATDLLGILPNTLMYDGCPTGTIPATPQTGTDTMCSSSNVEVDDTFRLDAHAGRSAWIKQCTFKDFTLNQFGIETSSRINYLAFILLQPIAASDTMQNDCGVHKVRWHYRQAFSDDGILPAQYIDEFSRDVWDATTSYNCTTDTITSSNIQFMHGAVSDPNPYQDAIQEWLDGSSTSDGTVTPATNNSTATFDATTVTSKNSGANDYIYMLVVPNVNCYASNPLDAFPGQPSRDIAYQMKLADPVRSAAIFKVEYLDASDVVLWYHEFFKP